MEKYYLSKVFDLTHFGIYNISNAILYSDSDNGVVFDISFDGGKTFQRVSNIHEGFPVRNSKGKIQVKITFTRSNDGNIYMIKVNGYFYNLDVGTTIHFTKKTTKEDFTTNLGLNGFYSLDLPRGEYDIWYVDQRDGEKLSLSSNFNPELSVNSPNRFDKESIIEMAFRGVEWTKYSIFDDFTENKMLEGNAIIDVDGDLNDGDEGIKCRYWSIGFA